MELEAFGNLAWLLLSGGAFFVAMRYAAKPPGGAGEPLDSMARTAIAPPALASARDPVCGMTLEPSGDISWIHGGHTYYFCSMSCRGRFRTSPQQFIGPRRLASPSHG